MTMVAKKFRPISCEGMARYFILKASFHIPVYCTVAVSTACGMPARCSATKCENSIMKPGNSVEGHVAAGQVM